MVKSRLGMTIIVFLSFFILLTLGIYFFQEKLIFFPETLPEGYSFHFNQEFDERNYQVAEGIHINALHFKVPKSKGIIFYAHGNAGSLRSWGYVADIFIQHNYDVLIYDYRGYGKSAGRISEENFYHDADVIYKELQKSYQESGIIVYGRSIGTGIAVKIAAEHNPGQLILESPFFNFLDLVGKIMPIIPPWLIRYSFRNDIRIQDVKCPVTIFHGTVDEVIYFGSSLKLEKLLKPGDRLIPIEGGHHNDLENFELFHRELAKALDRNPYL